MTEHVRKTASSVESFVLAPRSHVVPDHIDDNLFSRKGLSDTENSEGDRTLVPDDRWELKVHHGAGAVRQARLPQLLANTGKLVIVRAG